MTEDPRWNAGLKLMCSTKSRLRFPDILDAVQAAWDRDPDLSLADLMKRLTDGAPTDDYTLYKRAYQERSDIKCGLVASDTE